MTTPASNPPDIYERVSRAFVLAILALAVLAVIITPILASQWAQRPFPGFLIEETLVVNDRTGQDWSGRSAGLGSPQQVVRVAGAEVRTSAEFERALSGLKVGDEVSFFSRQPDGTARLYPGVALMSFPARDLFLHFWLPYLVGLAYLGISIWMYRLRGRTRSGRAFVFFCICVSIACTLLFDVLTTHVGTWLWILAIAGSGGALISLGLRFPEEWRAVQRRPWILGIPYLISLALGVWALVVLQSPTYPWAFTMARSYSYRYAVLGILVFLGIMLYRSQRSTSSVVRRQARLVLLGSIIAFAPIGVWFVAPNLGLALPFNAALMLLALLIFPVAVITAILRYRLLEVEVILNRTVFYGLLTAILAGATAVLISLTQRLFQTLTGEKNDAALVISTLVVVAIFTPIKNRVQMLVDRRFKEVPDTTRQLRRFGDEVRSYLLMNDPELIARLLLHETVHGLGAESGAIALELDGQGSAVWTIGNWRGAAAMCLALEHDGVRYGMISVGWRPDHEPYTQQEAFALKAAASQVARIIRLNMARSGVLERATADLRPT